MRAIVVLMVGMPATFGLARRARRIAVAERLAPVGSAPRRRRALPGSVQARLDRALEAAALDLAAEQALAVWAGVTAAAVLLGFGFGGIAVGVALALAVVVSGPLVLFALRHRRERRVVAAVPDVVERIASELRAGGTIATALDGVAAGDGALAADAARIGARTRMGSSLVDALAQWPRERPAPGIAPAAGALALCTTVGGRAADALEALAGSLRDRAAVAAEARALSAQARLSALVVGGGPLVYLVWTAIVDPGAIRTLAGTPIGHVCLAVGLALEAVGIGWMRRIIRAGQFV